MSRLSKRLRQKLETATNQHARKSFQKLNFETVSRPSQHAPKIRTRHTLPGETKMSAVILKLADPLIEELGQKNPAAVRKIISLTVIAWNWGMLPADQREADMRMMLQGLSSDVNDAQLRDDFRVTIERIDRRRQLLFPSLRKFIVSYELEETSERRNLQVASTALPI